MKKNQNICFTWTSFFQTAKGREILKLPREWPGPGMEGPVKFLLDKYCKITLLLYIDLLLNAQPFLGTWNKKNKSSKFLLRHVPSFTWLPPILRESLVWMGGGGEVFPHMDCTWGRTGMCNPRWYSFSAILATNRVCICPILVLNRVWFLYFSLFHHYWRGHKQKPFIWSSTVNQIFWSGYNHRFWS